jgi:hypothetical protein
MSITILHLCAPSDPSGNPQRCYLILGAVQGPFVVDEGYQGWQAVPARYRNAARSCSFRLDIPRAEYHHLVKCWS